MPIRFACQQCKARVKVPDGSEGRTMKCPRCGFLQRVPDKSEPPAKTHDRGKQDKQAKKLSRKDAATTPKQNKHQHKHEDSKQQDTPTTDITAAANIRDELANPEKPDAHQESEWSEINKTRQLETPPEVITDSEDQEQDQDQDQRPADQVDQVEVPPVDEESDSPPVQQIQTPSLPLAETSQQQPISQNTSTQEPQATEPDLQKELSTLFHKEKPLTEDNDKAEEQKADQEEEQQQQTLQTEQITEPLISEESENEPPPVIDKQPLQQVPEHQTPTEEEVITITSRSVPHVPPEVIPLAGSQARPEKFQESLAQTNRKSPGRQHAKPPTELTSKQYKQPQQKQTICDEEEGDQDMPGMKKSIGQYTHFRYLSWFMRGSTVLIAILTLKVVLSSIDTGEALWISLLYLFGGLAIAATSWVAGELAFAVWDIMNPEDEQE